MKDDNMRLWNAVCETNPKHTKKVSFGRGFTAIDPMHQVKNATEQFGPAGQGWGWEISDPIFLPTNDVSVKVTLWYTDKSCSVSQFGQASLYTDKTESKKDTDCMKKAATDGITKCLSYIGFNADVFLGKFDDNKYVQEMYEKHKDPEEFTIEHKKLQRDMLYEIALCQDEYDVIAIEENIESIDVPQAIKDVILDAAGNAKKQIENGLERPVPEWGFVNVGEAVEFAKLANDEINSMGSVDRLNEWMADVSHKLPALDVSLSAKKYQTEEGGPYKRICDKYNKKVEQLMKEKNNEA